MTGAGAYTLSALLTVFLLGALGFAVTVLWEAAWDLHQRGMARIHAHDRSWQPRVPQQRQPR